MGITHTTVVATADDGTSPVGSDEWNADHTATAYPLTSGGFNAAFCDGSVRFLKQNIKESVLRALITRNGGELIDPSDF